MPTELDDELVPEVQALLDEYGVPALLIGEEHAVDPVTGFIITPAPAPENQSVRVTPPYPAQQRWWKTDVITRTRMQSLIAAQRLTWPPKNGHTVTLHNSTIKYAITEVAPIYSGELICAYMVLYEN